MSYIFYNNFILILLLLQNAMEKVKPFKENVLQCQVRPYCLQIQISNRTLVPSGVDDGQTVRMNVGNKELFITFKVEKSRYFKRDGSDVHTDAEISLSQAVFGGTVNIL